MNSLLITVDFPPVVSGISTFFYNLWRLMPKENNLILAPGEKGYRMIDKNNDFSIIRYPVFYRPRPLRIIALLFYVFRIIHKEKIDILICGSPVSLGLIGLISKKIAKIPYCVFYYGGEFEKYKMNIIIIRLLKKVLKNAQSIITNSEFSSGQVKRYGIKEDKIVKITPGVDTDIFRPDLDCTDLRKRFELNDKRVLLTVSRLVKRKGIDTVIDALPIIVKNFPNIVYLIVGSGKEKLYFKTLVQQKDLEKNVIFVGSVTNDELPKYYNLSDVYVMPNRETKGEETLEGFGISFIEAGSCGRSVIGGKSGGVNEAIEDGNTGILVNPLSKEEVAAAILKLLRDEHYAKKLGDNGRLKAERDFRWTIIAERFNKSLELSLDTE